MSLYILMIKILHLLTIINKNKKLVHEKIEFYKALKPNIQKETILKKLQCP